MDYLICPECGNALELEIFEYFQNQKRIKEGLLLCSCGQWFPIINGIPRILIGKLRNLIKIHHSNFLVKYSQKLFPIEQFERDFLQERTALSHEKIKPLPSNFKEWDEGEKPWIEPLTPEFYVGKIILDAGCRLGNHTYFAAKYGAKLVIGIDIGETVEYAFEANREMDNVLIIQADIHNIPTKTIFDFIFSIGVLHHLPVPEKGFTKLLEKSKSNSKLLIWVYRLENYQDLKLILLLRKFTTRSIILSKFFSFIHTTILVLRIRSYNLRFKKYEKRNLFFEYLKNFNFNQIKEYVFDQLAPPIAYYYSKEELETWFKQNDIKEYQLFNMWNSGWKAIITKI